MIRKALNDAVRKKMIQENIAVYADVPRDEKYKPRIYDEKQIDKLLEIVKNTIIEPAVYLGLLGLRRGEILGLKWENIDLQGKKILIKETRLKTIQGVIKDTTKTEGSTRSLVIPQFIYEYLRNLKKEQLNKKEKYGDAYHESGYVCTYEDGQPLKPTYLTHKWKEIVEKSELPYIRFHDLRHTAATFLIKNHVPMKVVQEILGHSKISTTMDIYGHVDIEMKKLGAETVNKMFESNKNQVVKNVVKR